MIKFSELDDTKLTDLFTCEELDEIIILLKKEIMVLSSVDHCNDSVFRAVKDRKDSLDFLSKDLELLRIYLMKRFVKRGLRNDRLIVDE